MKTRVTLTEDPQRRDQLRVCSCILRLSTAPVLCLDLSNYLLSIVVKVKQGIQSTLELICKGMCERKLERKWVHGWMLDGWMDG